MDCQTTFDFEQYIHQTQIQQKAQKIIQQGKNTQQNGLTTQHNYHTNNHTMSQHTSPTVRMLQQQILHAHHTPMTTEFDSITGSRPRRAASASCAGKRRRVEDSPDENGSGGEEDEDESHDGVSDDDTPKRSKTNFVRKAGQSAAEAKRLRRQQQNRDAAATSRNRKKAYLASLEKKNETLEAENIKLKSQMKEQSRLMAQMKLQLDALRGKQSPIPGRVYVKVQPTAHHASADPIPNLQPIDSTAFQMSDLAAPYDSPMSPDSDSAVHSSAPTSPMSSHDSQFGSDSSSHPHVSPRARLVQPLQVTVAPVLLDEEFNAMQHSDYLPPLASPNFQKQASQSDAHMQFETTCITNTVESPYESVFLQSSEPVSKIYSTPTSTYAPHLHSSSTQQSVSSLQQRRSFPLSSSAHTSSSSLNLEIHDPAVIENNQQCCLKDSVMEHPVQVEQDNKGNKNNVRMVAQQSQQSMVMKSMMGIPVMWSLWQILIVCMMAQTLINNTMQHYNSSKPYYSSKISFPTINIHPTAAAATAHSSMSHPHPVTYSLSISHLPVVLACS